MSTQDDLGRTLRERADSVTGTPLTFDDVRGRARRIRRRQSAAVAGGLALVAAVALPIALLGGSGGDRSDPDPAPSPTRAADPSVTDVPTLQDGEIVYPDGPRIPLALDPSDIRTFTPLGSDRWVVTTSTDRGTDVVVVGSQGQVLGTYQAGGIGILAVDDGRDAVAWMRKDGSPMLLVAGEDEPEALAHLTFSGPAVATIVGDCALECEVLGRYSDGGPGLGGSWGVSTTGAVRDLPDGLPAVIDATADGTLLAGVDRTAPDGIHACGGVYDVRADAFAWEDCEGNDFAFSPGSALVMTLFSEGAGPRSVAIRDARSGTVVGGLDDVGLITSWAWEDAQHLLVVVAADDGSVSVQRISPDGPAETVIDGLHTDDPTLDVPVQLPLS